MAPKFSMDEDQEIREFQREYTEFLDDKDDQGLYDAKIRDLIRENHVRLIVNINDLRKKNIRRATKLLHDGVPELVAFQGALRDCVLSIDATYGKEVEELHIGLEGSFGSKHVTPRSLTAAHLGSMVCLEGIITKCSMVHPKVVKSVHYCPATAKTIERKYSDLTSLNSFPTSAAYPTKDEDGNPLETEYGLSVFKDHQTFIVQEMPERAPAGQLPRSVEVITDDDLVDSCKPGDRVQVIGVYRCLPFKKGGYTTGAFRTVIIANNVVLMSKEVAPHFTAKDVTQIKRFCRKRKYGNPIELLTKSLAPSIHGHEQVKLAILCMLLGGVEKVLENGTRLRGDINILLIGDPSTAKSQMLRYVLHTAPRAVTTTGRGSSGVGLTAAVTMDPETNERQLEAGAMVLADRGVVCIDEFDKMSDIDRTAIHEVMEQGRVTIAKAGIHAKLNARCSVLAAANPVYGRYDEYKNPMDNIGMQDSLLSRFDLIFIVLDEMDPERDKRISDHVLRMHRYRNPGEQDGEALPLGIHGDLAMRGAAVEDKGDEEQDTPIFETHHHLLHGDNKQDKVLSMQFMKKYVHVAKLIKPQLTRDACDTISTEYAKLRAQETVGTDKAKTQPVTARTLETMIRLSTAHARARMSKTVDLEDAEAAIDLINYAYFKKVVARPKKKKKEKREDKGDDDDDDDDDEARPSSKRKRTTKQKRSDDPYEFYSSEDDDDGRIRRAKQAKGKPSVSMDTTTTTEDATPADDVITRDLTPERLQEFRSALYAVFSSEHSQSLSVDRVTTAINETNTSPFTAGEIEMAFNRMEEANQIMVSEGMVFLI